MVERRQSAMVERRQSATVERRQYILLSPTGQTRRSRPSVSHRQDAHEMSYHNTAGALCLFPAVCDVFVPATKVDPCRSNFNCKLRWGHAGVCAINTAFDLPARCHRAPVVLDPSSLSPLKKCRVRPKSRPLLHPYTGTQTTTLKLRINGKEALRRIVTHVAAGGAILQSAHTSVDEDACDVLMQIFHAHD